MRLWKKISIYFIYPACMLALGLFAGLNSGRYDIVANGVEVTDERSQAYDFSDPYAYINTVIIVRDDNDDITSFEDLDGKTTANTLASTYSLLAESYGAKATGVDSLADTILLVEQGRVDATLNADVSFFDYMKVHPVSTYPPQDFLPFPMFYQAHVRESSHRPWHLHRYPSL